MTTYGTDQAALDRDVNLVYQCEAAPIMSSEACRRLEDIYGAPFGWAKAYRIHPTAYLPAYAGTALAVMLFSLRRRRQGTGDE